MYFRIDKEQVMVSLKSLPGIHSFTSFRMFALSRIGALYTEDFSSTPTVTKWDFCILFFVTPEGFNAMVANEGQEKA